MWALHTKMEADESELAGPGFKWTKWMAKVCCFRWERHILSKLFFLFTKMKHLHGWMVHNKIYKMHLRKYAGQISLHVDFKCFPPCSTDIRPGRSWRWKRWCRKERSGSRSRLGAQQHRPRPPVTSTTPHQLSPVGSPVSASTLASAPAFDEN